ncbi:MAG TPA: NPCBM/NEW2 domain-containing protein [Candidatus Paceibacterota bacterium]|nr:NPCBM/NEW2 domain-containing protein [Candidatus Paceibacterota bacterium]HRZ56674.1 NPCBM/NEW2 domain-containing protein [Candidatus Paceibacterota bacterium]
MKTRPMTFPALALAGALACSLAAWAVAPTEIEREEAARWAAAKFRAVTETAKPASGLHVLANNDPVQLNSRAGKPLRIAEATYTRGLYCHASSRLVVRLPGRGAGLNAVVGVDSNEQTSGGRGSVRFSVEVDGQQRFKSALLREGMAGVPVRVALGGAVEFALVVEDGGDGISCDQADWAEARVLLEDGRQVWLADLPLVEGGVGKPLSADSPFAFTYDGKRSADLLPAWTAVRSSRDLDERRIEHTVLYSDKGTGLEVRCVAIEYRDFPTVEWTVHFKNQGQVETPVLSDILALDLGFERSGRGEFVLHHFRGSPCLASDFEPFQTVLQPGTVKRITAAGGRPTNSDMPYFNVAGPDAGVIVVVGWPGQWAAQFARDQATGLRITAGQEKTRLRLRPGEEVRTPLMALQFWRGDWIRAQNLWRRWMLAHNLPRPGGSLPPVQMAACSSHQFGEMINANTANQKLFVDRYLEERLPLDYWWMDAGWYWCEGSWPRTGTWEVDTNRFPGGLRPISDYARAKGVKTIVWFEPERVHSGTWLAESHPEWILGGKNGGLLNLGDAAARRWLTDHVDRLLTEQGIDLYRQDFNMDPLDSWRRNDAEDRQGITENHHVTGYLAYWDELRRRHPNMLIDSCASGGRRNDLETLRRAVPLLRSDYIMEPVGNQGHTYGLSFWVPFQGTGTGSGALSPYLLRSTMHTHFTACFDVRRKDLDYDMIRRVLGQWRRYADCYYGDYYPLTPYSLDRSLWMAWQFDLPEKGQGLVQAFRRDQSVYESARFKLAGLDPEARYAVTNLDSGDTRNVSGFELIEVGLSVEIADLPGDAVLVYSRL